MSKKILFIYGTSEGHTRKVAGHVADVLRRGDVNVTLLDAADADQDAPLPAFDACLVAASVHIGGFQNAVARLVRENAAAIAAAPNAFLSVSLSAAGDDEGDWQGLERCLEDFFEKANWRPRHVEHVAGAFRYTQYDFFKRWAMKSIAKKRGAPVDTSRDWELTEWPKLTRFAEAFAKQLEAA